MPEQKYQEDDSMLPKENLKPNPWAKCKFFSVKYGKSKVFFWLKLLFVRLTALYRSKLDQTWLSSVAKVKLLRSPATNRVNVSNFGVSIFGRLRYIWAYDSTLEASQMHNLSQFRWGLILSGFRWGDGFYCGSKPWYKWFFNVKWKV